MAPCQIATAFGSRVGAGLADIRPSYGRAQLSTMRPEAGLPSMGWAGSGAAFVASPLGLLPSHAQDTTTALAVLNL